LKLLLDQNLSFRLLEKLEPVYPGSTQVKFVNLDQADDLAVWRFAKDKGFTIVTQDSDFHEFSLVYGNPPKVIWLKCGNKPKWYVLGLLLNNQDKIKAFLEDQERKQLFGDLLRGFGEVRAVQFFAYRRIESDVYPQSKDS
jgi:predicted nuclease of predicted toxin-antitoxin system